MKTQRIAMFVVMALLIAACGSSGGSGASPPPPTASATPRLSPGPYLGYIVGFDALDANQTALANSLEAQAVAAGQDFTRVQIDWADLEQQPGVFETGELMAALDQANATGQTLFLSLSTLDTGSLTLPPDLMSADASMPAAGLALDGAEIGARFRAFLDWLIPELAAYNVWGMALANESSTNFGAVPRSAVTNFLSAGADHARSVDPDLAITITIVGEFVDPEVEQFAIDLMPHLDFAMFNFYCLDGQTLLTTDSTHWADSIAEQIRIADGREIVYQELGCPAGYDDLGGSSQLTTGIGASAELQDEFFEYMVDEIITRDELRGAYVFQLFDWSPALAQSAADSLIDTNDPGATLAAERLIEWLMTVGMCRWAENTCRPAWDSYIDGVSRTADERAAR